MNTASMLHSMTAANVEKEVEDDEPDSQNDLKKSKTLIYLTKLKRIEKKKKSRVKILRKIVKFQKNLQQKRKRKLLVKMRRKRPIRRRK